MNFRELAANAQAWPFEEARKLLPRVEKSVAAKGYVLFETGYGPSGLPHIGTFGEVARTSMVRHAFKMLSDAPSKLICFSDDMDGMRKVPGNVPNQDMLKEHLGKPLTVVPDPFGQYESFGHHNNAMLRRFLDTFGFEYEFASATDYYRRGEFDAMLMRMLERYDDVMAIMLPTLRDERRQTYAPFLPVHPETGVVMQVPIEGRDAGKGTILWTDPVTGTRYETSILKGGCKAQWKPDWALRWAALGVDYEMSGKDHIDNVKTSSKICRVLGAEPPDGFNYELFLDEDGEKISKSKGNGITIDDWLRYASPESLALYMFQKPKTAKRLYFDVIPKAVDEYAVYLEKYDRETPAQRLENPVFHIHAGNPPDARFPVSFALLLTLVSASSASTPATLWGFIRQYAPGASPESHPALDRLVGYAIRYYEDFVKPAKRFEIPDTAATAALRELDTRLCELPTNADGEQIQATVYEVGRAHYPDLAGKAKSPDGRPGVSQEWFAMLYRTLIGQERGPRFGTFAAIYGIAPTRALIEDALKRKAA
ncbi:MAG: lysine--tRNA ligase [Alphaproteobacteria bacterium]|nr:lysine--tRNA ligase [Alphaproteobacteria bacterium]